MSQPHNWYAVQTRYRFEAKVAAHLERKRVEIFLPALQEVHRWSDRKKRISIPLFSGYVFAHLQPSPSTRLSVLRTEGVIGFVGSHGEASAIPEKQIKDLQQLLSHKVPCSLHSFLKTGRRVRIRGGCLDGLEGILERTGERLVISIETVERALSIEVRGYELELV
jgi:transcription antitermination factor NusG